ncbi:hypothetical protein QOZ80_6AG0537100 [Eleusine coracana subsp. coracana]|nr:hypothetical protein QOZ80_6AG0537100 [Eleusine coracana subsp. coracana]
MDGAEPDPDADGGGREASAGVRLTEDLILEILSHLPAKSLHRFKCVSRQWLGLISDPNNRRKFAQTLAGFFYIRYRPRKRGADRVPHSLSFSSADPDDGSPPLINPYSALSVPPFLRNHLHRVDCVNGLVLLHFWMPSPDEGHRYAVCNPATDEWFTVPESPTRGKASFVRLSVTDNPAASSPLHFHVFEFRGGIPKGYIVASEIYSSASDTWIHRENVWDRGAGEGISLLDETSGVFFRGALHLAPMEPVIVSVDGDGNKWKISPKPSSPEDDGFLGGPEPGFLGLSQGRLHFLNTQEYNILKLCHWELNDDDVWVMKHCIDLTKLFTGRWQFTVEVKFSVIGVHPDANTVYFLHGKNHTLISCTMDREEGRVIREFGLTTYVPYLPYVPLFSVPLAIRALEQ